MKLRCAPTNKKVSKCLPCGQQIVYIATGLDSNTRLHSVMVIHEAISLSIDYRYLLYARCDIPSCIVVLNGDYPICR